MMALAHATAEDFAEHLARWGPEVRVAFIDADSDDVTAFLLYLMSVNPRNDPERLAQVVKATAGPDAEKSVMTAAERLIEQGLQQGLEQTRTILRRQLEQRFGPLPAQDAARIAAASSESLERWALRVLHADQLESVFAD